MAGHDSKQEKIELSILSIVVVYVFFCLLALDASQRQRGDMDVSEQSRLITLCASHGMTLASSFDTNGEIKQVCRRDR